MLTTLTLALLLHPQVEPSEPGLLGVSQAPVCVAPDGTYWTGKRNGRLYFSRDDGRSWREASVPSEKKDQKFGSADDMDLVRFLSDQVGLVVGHIAGEDGYLRTEDGGSSWSMCKLPSQLYPWGATSLNDGTVWVFGNTGEILFSSDLAKTWTSRPTPFTPSHQAGCLYFESRDRGIAGARYNRLFVTGDGGATWIRVPTPVDELGGEEVEEAEAGSSTMATLPDGSLTFVPVPAGPSAGVYKARALGQGMVVSQEGVYFSKAMSPPTWSELTVEGRAVQDFEVHPMGMAVLDEGGYVSLLSPEGLPLWTSNALLDRGTFSHLGGVSVDGEDILAYDGRSTMLRAKPSGESVLVPMSQSLADAYWVIDSFDIDRGGTMWGVSEGALCRSQDFGRTWHRVVSLPKDLGWGVELAVRSPGELFIWNSGAGYCWSSSSGEFERVPFVDPKTHVAKIVGVERRGELWFAFGMRSASGAEPAHLGLMHSIDVDESIDGILLVSKDKGASWRPLHVHPHASIEALHLNESGTLLAYVAGGGVLRGEFDAASPSVELELVVQPNTVIPFEFGAQFDFISALEGILCGDQFYGNTSHHFLTTDAGRTWTPIEANEDWYEGRTYRLGTGRLVKVIQNSLFETDSSSKSYPEDEVIVHGGSRWNLPRIERVRVDHAGRLLVELDNGELRALDADGAKWTQLRPARE